MQGAVTEFRSRREGERLNVRELALSECPAWKAGVHTPPTTPTTLSATPSVNMVERRRDRPARSRRLTKLVSDKTTRGLDGAILASPPSELREPIRVSRRSYLIALLRANSGNVLADPARIYPQVQFKLGNVGQHQGFNTQQFYRIRLTLWCNQRDRISGADLLSHFLDPYGAAIR